jgi:hypothetical protein
MKRVAKHSEENADGIPRRRLVVRSAELTNGLVVCLLDFWAMRLGIV